MHFCKTWVFFFFVESNTIHSWGCSLWICLCTTSWKYSLKPDKV